jgi:hypothetical protein
MAQRSPARRNRATSGRSSVNKHRRRTPGYVRANPLIEFVNLADNRGPDRRRSGPYPERISSCYIKALRSSELGSRFGAYSQLPDGALRIVARGVKEDPAGRQRDHRKDDQAAPPRRRRKIIHSTASPDCRMPLLTKTCEQDDTRLSTAPRITLSSSTIAISGAVFNRSLRHRDSTNARRNLRILPPCDGHDIIQRCYVSQLQVS